MCGIYGSTSSSKFEILDQVNRQRGNFASGLLYHDKNNFDIFRTDGSFDWDDIKLPDGLTYLGHNQAPTSTERTWREHNSHPFVTNNWAVAHNGVLTNFNELKSEYLPEHENIVDSSIIPALLSHFEQKIDKVNNQDKEVQLIAQVLELLRGTFGLWIVNLNTLNVYLARQGSTLFYDHNSFTSAKGVGYKDLKEGSIYKFNSKGIKSVGTFNVQSPFLEL